MLFLITSLDYSAGASIYSCPTTCLPIKPVKPKLLPCSICNQTDRRCLLHRVIRSFHGYLEATGRPRACTCARVPRQKSGVTLGQDAWPSVTFTGFLHACSSFRPELSLSPPSRSQLTLSSVRQNLILIDVSTKILACISTVKKKSWETPWFNGIIYIHQSKRR